MDELPRVDGDKASRDMRSAGDARIVVIDCGGSLCRAGFAGDDAPSAAFLSVVGRPKKGRGCAAPVKLNASIVGDEARAKRNELSLRKPVISRGVAMDFDGLVKIWHHTYFNELRIKPDEHPVILTEAPLTPRSFRERMLEVFFETFEVPSVCVQIPAVLSLFASGRTTGIVIDCGESGAHVAPVYEGHSIPHAIMRLDIAGRDLTENMASLLNRERGGSSALSLDVANDIKETLCYVAADYDAELRNASDDTSIDRTYTLEDGGVVTLGNERFRCPEILFRPSFIGKEEGRGIQDMTFQSIESCPMDVRASLFSNVVLSGGTMAISGMEERMKLELAAMALTKVKVTLVSKPQHSAWIGASMFAKISRAWISAEEYSEQGCSVAHKASIL
mmetsp:Transcript_39244/g.108094  ORF Transcript_39244/g.108094 Transcript_39244/m.108094 type:complete len:391 (+) Transcript_39244:47-1219(+)